MSIQNTLKNRRKELNLTLNDVAKRVGVTEATVQRWESGNIKNLRHERIAALADALETTPSYIMGWESDFPSSGSPRKISDEELKFALFNGRQDITDDMFAEVKNFANYIMSREDAKRKDEDK